MWILSIDPAVVVLGMNADDFLQTKKQNDVNEGHGLQSIFAKTALMALI